MTAANSTKPKRSGVTILGYYGADNTGDEAILQAMIESLNEQGITDITVLSRNPEKTAVQHGVKSLYTGRRFHGLTAIYRQLKNSELFILGGGGLLQDHSARVVPYWLSRVFLAHLSKTPVYYYAQGVGPLYTNRSRRLVKALSKRVKYITVRDRQSLDLIRDLNITRPTIELTADPALALSTTADGAMLLQGENITLSKNRLNIAIALRPWLNEEYQANLLATLKQLITAHNLNLTFIPFQYNMDEAISERFASELDQYVLHNHYSPAELLAILQQFDGIIAMRLHALILGANGHRPVFALCYDNKVENFMDRIAMKEYSYRLEQIAVDPGTLNEKLTDWLTNLDQLAGVSQPYIENLALQAKRNAQIARELLEHQ